MHASLAALAFCLAVFPALRAAAQVSPPRAPVGARAQPSGTAAGSVRSDHMSVEVLPPRTGNEIRMPEGFIRLEGSSAGPVGYASFGTYRAGQSPSYQVAAAGAAPSGGNGRVLPPPAPPRDPCRAERSSYLRRLLVMQGIYLDDPLAFLEGMTGPGGYPAQYLFTALGLLPGADPIRPLAWDQELRSLARDLTACSQAGER